MCVATSTKKTSEGFWLRCAILMQLYEEVCDAEGCNDIGCRNPRADSAPATIMLLPPQFSVLNESRLPELVHSPKPAHKPNLACLPIW